MTDPKVPAPAAPATTGAPPDDEREFYCGCEHHRIGTERPSWDEDGCCTVCGVDVDPWTIRAVQAEAALASSRRGRRARSRLRGR